MEGDVIKDEMCEPLQWLPKLRLNRNASEAERSFIAIPEGSAIQQLKCLLSVPLEVSNNKSPG